jgi:hypothetical protein
MEDLLSGAATRPQSEREQEILTEVKKPQLLDRSPEWLNNNQSLGGRSVWPLVCTCRWSMHTPLRRDNLHEGGEGLAECLISVAMKVGVQELSKYLERLTPITQH